MSNFSDFINSNKGNSNKENIKKNDGKKYSQQELQDMIDKYSRLSNDNLMSEFLRLTIEKKRKGQLNDKELENIKQTILPMLNSEQKVALDQLLEMVKNVK